MADLPANASGKLVPPLRPELERTPIDASKLGEIQRTLSMGDKIWGNEAVRKFSIVIVLLACWQGYAMYKSDPLVIPTAIESHQALFRDIISGEVLVYTWYSIQLLLTGYAIGATLAAILSIAATFTRVGRDILETLTAMFSPLPAIALVPLAMIWFGLGKEALIFVLIHSVLWPVALNMHGGFRSVSPTLRMVGANYGMNPLSYVINILFPAAFPSVLTGLKIGWAFAWRTLIAAELVFGVASGGGGLGWYIYQAKNTFETPTVFAGLLMVIVIGLAIENLIFRTIEVRTVRKWGMQN
jgi:NitT/TauT family transport system permease protein